VAELARLNEAYEAKFPGLRFVVFVNGRGRGEIMTIMRERIERGDWEAERDGAIEASVYHFLVSRFFFITRISPISFHFLTRIPAHWADLSSCRPCATSPSTERQNSEVFELMSSVTTRIARAITSAYNSITSISFFSCNHENRTKARNIGR